MYSLAVSPELPGNVFAATDYGVFRSTDNGSHWTRGGLGYPTYPIYTIAVKSTAGGTGVQIFAGEDYGHVLYYDGTTWSSRNIIGSVALGRVKVLYVHRIRCCCRSRIPWRRRISFHEQRNKLDERQHWNDLGPHQLCLWVCNKWRSDRCSNRRRHLVATAFGFAIRRDH